MGVGEVGGGGVKWGRWCAVGEAAASRVDHLSNDPFSKYSHILSSWVRGLQHRNWGAMVHPHSLGLQLPAQGEPSAGFQARPPRQVPHIWRDGDHD